MAVPFMNNFRSLNNKFPTIFYVKFIFFSISLPRLSLFFSREMKVKPKIFGTKTAMQRKILTFVKL